MYLLLIELFLMYWNWDLFSKCCPLLKQLRASCCSRPRIFMQLNISFMLLSVLEQLMFVYFALSSSNFLLQFFISSGMFLATMPCISMENWISVNKSNRKKPIPTPIIRMKARSVLLINLIFPYGYFSSTENKASAKKRRVDWGKERVNFRCELWGWTNYFFSIFLPKYLEESMDFSCLRTLSWLLLVFVSSSSGYHFRWSHIIKFRSSSDCFFASSP